MTTSTPEKLCANCGEQIPSRARKCTICGKAVVRPNCPRCGKTRRKGFGYYSGWETDEGVAWGVLCATCDRRVGHMNLVYAGFDDEMAHETNMAIIAEAMRESGRKRWARKSKRKGTRPW